jgi:hypothetical protein
MIYFMYFIKKLLNIGQMGTILVSMKLNDAAENYFAIKLTMTFA